jgi:hypothetical protein
VSFGTNEYPILRGNHPLHTHFTGFFPEVGSIAEILGMEMGH